MCIQVSLQFILTNGSFYTSFSKLNFNYHCPAHFLKLKLDFKLNRVFTNNMNNMKYYNNAENIECSILCLNAIVNEHCFAQVMTKRTATRVMKNECPLGPTT